MHDSAHIITNNLISRLETNLSTLYRSSAKDIRKKITPLIKDMQTDDPEATQDERLKYANKTGLKPEVVDIVTDIITNTNEQSVDLINDNARQIYAINFKYACDNIVKQIKDSM